MLVRETWIWGSSSIHTENDSKCKLSVVKSVYLIRKREEEYEKSKCDDGTIKHLKNRRKKNGEENVSETN